MPSLTPGTLLADTYRVVRLIGVGGMGEVYEATHDRLAGRYAVKVLLAEIMSRLDVFQRFRREAEVTSGLRHPNIVQVLDFNVTPDGHPYLVMEYLDGVELAAEMARVGPMPPLRVLDIVGQIASALTAAQNHKIVHRDLKPQNLFLVRLPDEDREVVKVVDFGISKVREATTHLTHESAVIGTPQYMAPEQAQGKLAQIDERTDEFSLAAITYELFTGRPAFQGEAVPAILYQVVHEHPEPMSSLLPTPCPEVDAVIAKAMSKAPCDRYPSARAFHRELARAVAADDAANTLTGSQRKPVHRLTSTSVERTATTLGLAAAAVDNRTGRPATSLRRWVLAGIVATVVLAGATLAAYRWRSNEVVPSVSVAKLASSQTPIANPSVAGPKGPAGETEPSENSLQGGTPGGATDIQVVYSTEKRQWIEAVTADFSKHHPGIRIDLVGLGSIESANQILQGRLHPTVWSPSDSMVLKMLVADWHAKHHTDLVASNTVAAAQPLLLTPLVFIVWEDRARVLQRSTNEPIRWKTIRQGVTSAKGWRVLGGDAHWGQVRLGHTDPTQSNSGLQALVLMLLEHTRKAHITDADLQNPHNQDFVLGIEKGVTKFEPSTGVFATDMVRFGPSRYDISVVYESCAIAELGHAEGRWGKLKVSYPATTIWSDHPAVVLETEWVTTAQKHAADEYLAFLRAPASQQQALAFGFRPADTSIKIVTTDPKNPFTAFADHGVTVNLPPAADMPEGPVVRNLLTLWQRMMGSTATPEN